MAVGTRSSYSASIPQLWAYDLFAQAEFLTFWSTFEGPPGSSSPILRRDDLAKSPGDTIKFDIVLALTGTGMTGDVALLEGNEEALKIRQTSLTVDSKQHAVRWSDLAEVLIDHDMRTTAQNQLAKWWAGQMDNAIFAEFATPGGSVANLPTSAQWFAGSATTIGTVADGNGTGRLQLTDLTDIKAFAVTDRKLEPIRTEDGNEYFGLVCHPYTIMELKKYDTLWAQAQRDAQLRGPDNPVFTGAAGVWDGVILYQNGRVPVASDGASSIQVARNILFGAQAMSRGYAMYPKWIEEEFSYGQEAGIAVRAVYGNKANIFDLTSAGGASAANQSAIGHMCVYTAAVAPVA